MIPWFRRRKKFTFRMKPVEIGNGNLTVDLPDHFSVEQVDLTTIVSDPTSNATTLRFSSRFVSDPEKPDARGLGSKGVSALAKKEHKRIFKHGDKYYFTAQESADESGEVGDVHHWIVGFNNSVVFVSCWVIRKFKNDPASLAMLSAAEQAVHSLRESRAQRYKLSDPPNHEIAPLSPEHANQLDRWRQAAIDSARAVLGGPCFTGGDSDLQVIQALLENNKFDKNQTFVLEGLGVIFGGILARKLDLHWVSDTFGTDLTPALQYKETNIVLYPKDMIVKRVERGEAFDLMLLFNGLVEEVRKMDSSGKYR
jgi:hypothetical protein